MARGGGTANHSRMSPEAPKPEVDFHFTENERLFDRISHRRFLSLISNPKVVINLIKEDGNSFGEFLFVTVTQRKQEEGRPLTFYGLGYHEQRERWIHEYWRWYESYLDTEGKVVPKKKAMEQIKEREEWVKGMAASEPRPTRRAEMYALLADLTDEDGAMIEMEDFGWAFLGDLDE